MGSETALSSIYCCPAENIVSGFRKVVPFNRTTIIVPDVAYENVDESGNESFDESEDEKNSSVESGLEETESVVLNPTQDKDINWSYLIET